MKPKTKVSPSVSPVAAAPSSATLEGGCPASRRFLASSSRARRPWCSSSLKHLSRHTSMPQLLLMADSFAHVDCSPWDAVQNIDQLCPGGLLTLGCSTNMNQEKEGKFASSANQLGCTGELGLSRHTPMPQLLLMADSFAQVNSSPWSAVMNDMNEEENFASSANQFSACNAHHKHAWCGCSCS